MSILTGATIAVAEVVAERSGVRLEVTESTAVRPYVQYDSCTIVTGTPSLYNHEEYMQDIHSAIGHLAVENKEIFSLNVEESLETARDIMKDVHCDNYLKGEYPGRDRQIAEGYRRRLSAVQEAINTSDPVAASLLVIGNSLRHEGSPLVVPEHVSDVVGKLELLIVDKWRSLHSKKCLEGLLGIIKDFIEGQSESQDESQGGKGFSQTSSESLKQLGAINSFSGSYELQDVPYVPTNRVKLIDCTNEGTPTYCGTQNGPYISKLLSGFTLSKKVQKYLVSMSQVRSQVGLKSGSLCDSQIYRMYSEVEPRMFKRKQASTLKKDIAIAIMVDMSGSMEGSKYRTACSCAIATQEVLCAIGVPNELSGFTTYKEDYPTCMLYKKYSERSVARDIMIQRVQRGDIFHYNADGESILFVAQRLAKRPERQKVLIVLSDGSPAFGGATRYGQGDTYLKDVLNLIESSRGIDVLGVGIQDTSVKSYYKRCSVVNNLTDLEGVLMGLLKEKLL